MSNTYKSMKIAVNYTNREGVRKALDDAGYNLAGTSNQASAYYTYAQTPDVFHSLASESPKGCFQEHKHPEHFLVNGEFLTAEQIAAQKPPLKNIKVRVTSSAPAKDIVADMEKMGYELVSDSIHKDVEEGNVSWLFGNVGIGGANLIGAFEKNDAHLCTEGYEECFLFNGQIVDKEYFKQPATEKTYAPLSFEDRVVKALMSDEPLPLLPRVEHSKQRLLALLHAAIGYVENGEAIEEGVILEIDDINGYLAETYELS